MKNHHYAVLRHFCNKISAFLVSGNEEAKNNFSIQRTLNNVSSEPFVILADSNVSAIPRCGQQRLHVLATRALVNRGFFYFFTPSPSLHAQRSQVIAVLNGKAQSPESADNNRTS